MYEILLSASPLEEISKLVLCNHTKKPKELLIPVFPVAVDLGSNETDGIWEQA